MLSRSAGGPLGLRRVCFLGRSSLVPAAGGRLVARTAVPQADSGAWGEELGLVSKVAAKMG
jgi:hypothetical protein